MDLDGFIECAIATHMVTSQCLFAFLVLEGSSFGIPPMRLVRGSTLASLRRFPRSDETEHVVTVDTQMYDTMVEAFGNNMPFFISHREFSFPSCAKPRSHRHLNLIYDLI